MTSTDLLIIGGGINGTAIARDAAGRGLSVILCEKDDLARHTSSASTKLIHGGLRYLEYYEFRLVREALIEREVLLRSAPHIIRPMRFVLPYDQGQRPQWMLRLGLFLYDNLGGRELLPGTKTVNLHKAPHDQVLEPRLKTGFEYSDCWVEDARLVVLNAIDAANRGADIRVGTAVTALSPHKDGYRATLSDGATITARGIVNAAGPWVDEVLFKIKRDRNEAGLRLIKGSHIVTKRLFPGDHAYMFQNADNRIIFAIPYEGDYTLIGTTDVPWEAAPGPMDISPEEVDYLCKAASEYFAQDIHASDVVWSYAGVRPLYDDKSENASAVTRDYVLDIDEFSAAPDGVETTDEGRPVLSIYGGKITTSRKLAEHALQKLSPYYAEASGDWTSEAQLPGGDIPADDFEGFFTTQAARYPDVPADILRHLCRAYGTRITLILGQGPKTDLGLHFGAQLTEAEARYLCNHEWARRAEDILYRRTKQGLHLSAPEKQVFINWFNQLAEL
ncbi:glycerol-3-phosphate dehydrogenase [Algimonas porphyrae]|uniref:Glycerol-3-phosphate dehydrogenase n=1 Tax=Algimonas porphyrae TaxID=1128113 RepID=A0ABQ5V2X7_9PROT|nr:glycerol-3-phosphate dehydrogenase [Algimonas porphyrae]GLQ20946.1 glycerol-3-phosphate dehydrogenase [Algimonas porphyrae]